jgi:valyl-tRNA synthetase
MDTFFPTDVMVSGFDILENWISRMIMFTYFHENKEPFKNVYLTGLVLGTDGQKMSKSKKNVIDMDDIVRDYGTDSVRLAYFYQNSAGASYSMTYEKLKNFKGFLNKIWNASKFVLNNEQYVIKDFKVEDVKHDFSKKVLEHISSVNVHITENIDKFQLGLATFNLYQEFWHTYCDILIEESKEYLWDKKDKETGEITSSPDPEVRSEVATVMTFVLKSYLKLLHPFIPFITQTIWNEVPKNETEHKVLMYNAWEVK